ncbi:stage II sporulation protein P [Clostridium senegalense]|uniref:stage II sporulation protein P n=1 Tax=Clostridium senegalense TaxID=1465809 RepID=UPI001C10AF24|nr:stage II sporulation protein P [Clostridium senegalense]MBU5225479.1 stage II sporulation protein P [Clostridium senegalense]
MRYNREKYKRYNPRYNPRYSSRYVSSKSYGNVKNVKLNFKYMKFIIIILVATLLIILPKSFIIYEGHGSDGIKTTLYLKAINNSMATVSVSSNNMLREEDKGISSFSILELIKGELGFFDKNQVKQVKAEDYKISAFNLGEGDINKNEVSAVPKNNAAQNANKKILIYHSHSSEAYSPGEQSKKDASQNIIAVGEELTKNLQAQGFTVIHDTTAHDLPDYNAAYYKSRETMKKYLNEYGNFDLIIDLHRDSGVDKKYVTGNINGEATAKVMFVPAMANPNYASQLEIMNNIVGESKTLYPDLFRGRAIYDVYTTGITYYSQDLSSNAVLIEVGSTTNTLDEAKASMKYLAHSISAGLSK